MQAVSESYKTIKTISKDNKVTEEILNAVIQNVRGENGEVDEKKLTNINPVVETGLLLLFSLVKGDYELQSHLFKERIFHNIYDISITAKVI